MQFEVRSLDSGCTASKWKLTSLTPLCLVCGQSREEPTLLHESTDDGTNYAVVTPRELNAGDFFTYASPIHTSKCNLGTSTAVIGWAPSPHDVVLMPCTASQTCC